MMPRSEIQKAEKDILVNKQLIERRETALRLWKNPDFKKLVVEGFMLEDAARYVQESVDNLMEPHMRADALAMAQASGHLKRYLSLAVTMAENAEQRIIDAEELIVALRQEGSDE